MPEIPPEIEQALADMSHADFDILVAKVRAPDAAEALRDAASQHLSGERLEAFCALAHATAYVDETGTVNGDKLTSHLRGLFPDLPPAPPAGPRWSNNGQHTPPPPMPGPGDSGRAAAQKRFQGIQPARDGNPGRAAAEKRFGKREAQ
jgi:hypothetical protein